MEDTSKPRGAGGKTLVSEEEEIQRENYYDFRNEYLEAREKPCRVKGVVLKGNDRTKPNTVLQEFRNIYKLETLDQIKDELLEISACLSELDIFKEVDILVDTSSEDEPDAAELVVTVAEKSAASFSTEVFEGNASIGSQKSNTYAAGVRRSRMGGKAIDLSAQAFQSSKSHEKFSSYMEWMRGISLGLHIGGGRHGLTYEGAFREIRLVTPRVSEEIRKQGGHTLKSALGYSFAYDRRDHPVRPTRGFAAHGKLELAGFGIGPGVERFLRQHVKWQACVPLAGPFALDFRGQWGVLLPLSRRWDRPTCIGERFFLGGPGSLRGFYVNGAGPTDDRKFGRDEVVPLGQRVRDSVGGDIVCTFLASLTFDLPNRLMKAVGIHGHAFLNGGNVVPLLSCGPRSFLEGFRWSTGIGLVFPTRVGRLEINYCRILRMDGTDEAKHGMQFGFDTDHL